MMNKAQIMKRAWEIVRTQVGTLREKLSKALRQAWAEAKAVSAKALYEVFNEFSRAKVRHTMQECRAFGESFADKFIEKLDLVLDGRKIVLRTYDCDGLAENFKREATKENLARFFDKKAWHRTKLEADYEVVELSDYVLEENSKPCSFYSSLEAGRRTVETSEKWEGI